MVCVCESVSRGWWTAENFVVVVYAENRLFDRSFIGHLSLSCRFLGPFGPLQSPLQDFIAFVVTHNENLEVPYAD